MIIDGKIVAANIKDSIGKQLTRSSRSNVVPGIGIVMVGNNEASNVYVGIKEKVAKQLGFFVQIEKLPASATEVSVVKAIEKMNKNKKIHGILVQLPLPKKLAYQTILDTIILEKDIDCLNHASLGALLKGESLLLPPTAEAVRLLIEESGTQVKGADIVVVGAGFFGRQIALHLLNHSASVSIVHDLTNDISSYTKKADVIVSAVGKAGIITGSMIKKNAVVIDVGISVVAGKVVGDVDQMSVSKKAHAYTSVPGGVGPVTVACVMKNVMEAANRK